MERMMLEISVSDLKESNHFLNDLYQNVTAAIFLADSEARIYNFNDAFRTLFYKQEDQLLKELCGNAMGCVFAEEEGKDCGSTSNCKSYILRECILKSFTDKVPLYKERMTRRFYINDEVLSNAVVPRWGCVEKGTVWIRLNKSGEKQFMLSVSDEGQAISTRRFQQSGLGLELVYILCEQIHGRCRIEASGVVQIIFDSLATAEQCA